MMKHWKLYIAMLAIALGFTACSEQEDGIESNETCAVEFSISTKATATTDMVSKNQLMRLFVGERKPEHGVEELHLLGVMEDVVKGYLTFNNLKPQWYKFAFVCVPRYPELELFTEENPGEATCDMNRIMVDYEPILKQGAGSITPDIPIKDGNIYRKVVSLWLEKGKTATEHVVLTRLNGQLILDMGILCDQFEHYVDSIVLELTNLPTRLYITDNDKDEIKITDLKTVRFKTNPADQSERLENERKHHKLIVNLLPCELDGKIFVYTTAKNKVKEVFEFSLKTDTGQSFNIKRNTKTTLQFNGIYKGDFDVKYAGFDGTNIGVADDNWNGW